MDDPELAELEVRQLIQRETGLSWSDVDDLEVTLVDAAGAPVYVFDLLFTGFPGGGPGPSDADPARAALAADLPAGCRCAMFGAYPGLHCVRHGANRLAAIAALIAEVRDRYGLAR